jgi:hypothetical protein
MREARSGENSAPQLTQKFADPVVAFPHCVQGAITNFYTQILVHLVPQISNSLDGRLEDIDTLSRDRVELKEMAPPPRDFLNIMSMNAKDVLDTADTRELERVHQVTSLARPSYTLP